MMVHGMAGWKVVAMVEIVVVWKVDDLVFAMVE